jgi:translation machinery-associated protein 16
MHDIVTNAWLARNDSALAEERSRRRPGRPKSAKETKLEEVKLREAEEYRSGLGTPHIPPLILLAWF